MLKVIIPEDKQQIRKQIKVLEYQLKNDTSEKDRGVHSAALVNLKNRLL